MCNAFTDLTYDEDEEKDKEIKQLRETAEEMLGYFTNAREGFVGDHAVKCEIMVNVRKVDEWREALKEK